ncbi:hypothetical protein SUGI_1004480 [Cryptomeria japonica]|uniref:uncharacterized protein LOC131057698 n=1 Tax=Cryptomeria japonica TaxID=3369 RepID=UPI002414719A|nr:uncharacterized protein LOC131057698 [Cryptomeria japonica]GLJ47565.1 hypothetical protein SUGI_1004480 [Cryptomeria japonica]
MGSTTIRPGHRPSRSLSGIRTAFAPLAMPPHATDFNTMASDYSPRLRFCKRVSSTSMFPSKGPGFESQEPTSPQVTCTGHIKRKPHWAKASKQEAAAKPTKETSDYNKKISKLKKLMLGRHHNSKNSKPTEDDGGKCQPSLGAIKRYTSGSYEAKFGGLFVEDGPIVANLEAVPKEMGEISIW